jgi:hypothetical protein
MTNVEGDPNRTITVPFGGGGGSRGPITATIVSVVNHGGYLNVYPHSVSLEMLRKWKRGAEVSVCFKDGKPGTLRFREAHHQGHTLRKKSGQREHFAVPTAAFGKIDGSTKGVAVESWADDDYFYVRVGQLYGNNGEQG